MTFFCAKFVGILYEVFVSTWYQRSSAQIYRKHSLIRSLDYWTYVRFRGGKQHFIYPPIPFLGWLPFNISLSVRWLYILQLRGMNDIDSRGDHWVSSELPLIRGIHIGRKSATWHKFDMVWLYRLHAYPGGEEGVFYSYKWFLPAFAGLRGGGQMRFYLPETNIISRRNCCWFLKIPIDCCCLGGDGATGI
jgi:hypothetical protein